jgi:hypothetical protein
MVAPADHILSTGDTLTPCAGAQLRVPPPEPIVLSSPESSPPSDGEHPAVSFVPNSSTQAPAGRGAGAGGAVGPTQRKRGRVEANLNGESSQNTIGERRVRPKLEQWNNAPNASSTGPSAPPANHSRSRLFTTATGPGVSPGTSPHSVPSSSGTSNSPTTIATPSSQSDPSPRPVQEHQSPGRPLESNTTVLLATNPRTGPVSGGIEVWMGGKDFPVTFTLYARFGTHVTVTVSSIFYLLSQPSNPHLRLFRIRLHCRVYCPSQVVPAV